MHCQACDEPALVARPDRSLPDGTTARAVRCSRCGAGGTIVLEDGEPTRKVGPAVDASHNDHNAHEARYGRSTTDPDSPGQHWPVDGGEA